MPRKRREEITECRWLPWDQDCPAGWYECPPLAHHAVYGRLICRKIAE